MADVKPVTDIVEQVAREGSGGAVQAGLARLVDDDMSIEYDDDHVLIVPADIPLVRGEMLASLVQAHRAEGAAATVLAGHTAAALELPRVIRRERDGSFVRVSPSGDLVGAEQEITEYATGIWCVRHALLAPALRRLEPDARTGEIALAGIAEVLTSTGHRVGAHHEPGWDQVTGIHDRRDLAWAEAGLRERINEEWLERGVTMVDPHHTYIDATVTLAPDVILFPGVILQGSTVIGESSEIGPGSRLIDTRVGPRCRLDHTTAELATIGADCRVGPYAVLDAGAEIAPATVTGPFYNAGPDGP